MLVNPDTDFTLEYHDNICWLALYSPAAQAWGDAFLPADAPPEQRRTVGIPTHTLKEVLRAIEAKGLSVSITPAAEQAS